jgi:DNA-binding XRE family transcriptional regulator
MVSRRPRYNTNREWENKVHKVRVEEGFTVVELAKVSGTNVTSICELCTGMISPLYQVGERAGHIKPWVIRICEVLKAEPEYLFPREICPLEDPRLKRLGGTQITEILIGEYSRNITLDLYFRSLNPFIWRHIIKVFWSSNRRNSTHYKRLVKVILMRFLANMTLDEVAIKLGVTRERVRQLESKMLRHMRHPTFSRIFKDYYYYN